MYLKYLYFRYKCVNSRSNVLNDLEQHRVFAICGAVGSGKTSFSNYMGYINSNRNYNRLAKKYDFCKRYLLFLNESDKAFYDSCNDYIAYCQKNKIIPCYYTSIPYRAPDGSYSAKALLSHLIFKTQLSQYATMFYDEIGGVFNSSLYNDKNNKNARMRAALLMKYDRQSFDGSVILAEQNANSIDSKLRDAVGIFYHMDRLKFRCKPIVLTAFCGIISFLLGKSKLGYKWQNSVIKGYLYGLKIGEWRIYRFLNYGDYGNYHQVEHQAVNDGMKSKVFSKNNVPDNCFYFHADFKKDFGRYNDRVFQPYYDKYAKPDPEPEYWHSLDMTDKDFVNAGYGYILDKILTDTDSEEEIEDKATKLIDLLLSDTNGLKALEAELAAIEARNKLIDRVIKTDYLAPDKAKESVKE